MAAQTPSLSLLDHCVLLPPGAMRKGKGAWCSLPHSFITSFPLHTVSLPLSPLPPDRQEAPFSLPPRTALEENFTSIPQQGCLPTCSDNESFVGSSNKVTSRSQTRWRQWRDLWVWTKVEQEPWTTLILNLAASQGCPHFTVFMYVYICVRTCVYVCMCVWGGGERESC